MKSMANGVISFQFILQIAYIDRIARFGAQE